MTATKEQPNQRPSQPQQDEVGNWLSFPFFFWLDLFLPLYSRTLTLTCSARSVRSS